MAVKIRLKRMGKIRTPFYRIVVADARTKRDGRVIEEIGTYNPKTDPSLIKVDSDRAQHWLGVGAQPSEPVLALFRKTGDWQKFKGEPAPPPLLEAAPKKDKADTFNEVLKEVHGDSASEAVTAKKSSRKPAKTTEQAAAPKTEPTAAPDEAAAAAPDEPAAAAAPDEPAAAAAPDEPAAAPAPEASEPADPESSAGPADADSAPAEPAKAVEG